MSNQGVLIDFLTMIGRHGFEFHSGNLLRRFELIRCRSFVMMIGTVQRDALFRQTENRSRRSRNGRFENTHRSSSLAMWFSSFWTRLSIVSFCCEDNWKGFWDVFWERGSYVCDKRSLSWRIHIDRTERRVPAALLFYASNASADSNADDDSHRYFHWSVQWSRRHERSSSSSVSNRTSFTRSVRTLDFFKNFVLVSTCIRCSTM